MKTRRTFLKQSAQLSLSALFFSHLIACKSGDKKMEETIKEEIKKKLALNPDATYMMDYISGDVGFFSERGGTIGWIANKEGVVVVDTQFPDQSKNLITELQKINDTKIDLVINTHHHGDHSAGNSAYTGITDRILAHENSKANQERVATERNQEGRVLPDDTFADKRTEKIAGETISLHYFGAGHTDGDAIIHFENNNVVHMGDLMFNRRFPYIDKSAGANIENWISILDKTKSTFNPETKFIFGHSDNGHDILGNLDDISAFKNYLEKLLVFGKESISAGKELQELKKSATEIPGAPEWKGKGIERSLDAVYTELAS